RLRSLQRRDRRCDGGGLRRHPIDPRELPPGPRRDRLHDRVRTASPHPRHAALARRPRGRHRRADALRGAPRRGGHRRRRAVAGGHRPAAPGPEGPMSAAWRIYGAEMSPYSVKVRAYFRYKGIAHQWIVRSGDRMAEFSTLAKLPLIPLVVDPDGGAAQDSTPIIETVEARHPEPSIHPEDPVAAFASALLEEYGDEWGNKWMFHLRWAREVDQLAGATRIARTLEPDSGEERHRAIATQVRERMVGRVGFVGSNAGTAPIIEASFVDALRLLERHLAARPYLFGGRPAFADFGLWAQVRTAFTDPTGYGIIANRTPGVL